MKPESFAALARWIKERVGLVLQPEKLALVENRLAPVARAHGLADLNALVAALGAGNGGEIGAATIDALTTCDTSFFRDLHPFQQLCSDVLPKLMGARQAQKRVRIWSAGCASGQEAYSLAIMFSEAGERLKDWKIDIVATDINRGALARARTGLYGRFEVQHGLPVRSLLHHFTQEGDRWRISDDIRRRVDFRGFNLLDDPSPLGRFDVVFCRNVLTGFDLFARGAALGRIAQVLNPDGALYLGLAETVLGVTDRFVPLGGARAVYGLAAPSPAIARAS